MDSKTATERLREMLDEFEHECFMIRVEASETRAEHEVVRKAYERQREETVQAIAAMLGNDRIAELTVERDAYFEMVKRVQADCDARDALIRDMARELRGLNDSGVPTDCMEHEQRMRKLGIEVGE